MAFAQLVEAVPFYEGITLEEIGGRGVRWPERDAAAAAPERRGAPPPTAAPRTTGKPQPAAPPQTVRTAACGWGPTARSGRRPEVEISPALHYTIAHQQLELSPRTHSASGSLSGETVEVAQNGTRLKATAAVRTGVPAGTAFLADGHRRRLRQRS